LTNNEKWSNI